MKIAMEVHRSKRARCIPVILRPCDWHGEPFGKLMALPRDGKPITRWDDQDDAFLNTLQGIKDAIAKMRIG